MNPVVTQILYKTVTAAVVGAIMTIVLWPFRQVRKEWIAFKAEQASIHAELVQQRSNCLTTLQTQGVTQIELLGKTVAALDGLHVDLAEQTGYLRAMTAQPPRIRRIAKK